METDSPNSDKQKSGMFASYCSSLANSAAHSNALRSVQSGTDENVNNGAFSTPSTTSSRLKVHIRRWHAVAAWKWIANDDSCGICRMPFDACCADCKWPGDDCPLVWGQCSHCFHIHCIMKWLNSQSAQQHCPMCRQEWKFKE